MNHKIQDKKEQEENLNLDMLIKDDTGQEFRAMVLVSIKELESSLKRKGYRLSKI